MVLELKYLTLCFILTFSKCTTGRSENILDIRLETPHKTTPDPLDVQPR